MGFNFAGLFRQLNIEINNSWITMICLLALIFLPSVTSSCPWFYAERLADYDDKEISKTPMWTLNDLRKSECIYQCANETFCRSVHFNPSGSTCTAFRESFKNVTVPSTSQSGHTLFQLRKPLAVPGSLCEEEVDCDSLPNSQCHEESCRCDQGYDADGDTCRILTECTSFTNNFTKYHLSVILGHDIASRGGKNDIDCLQFCLDRPDCTSCDHDFVGNICYLQTDRWTQATPAQQLTTSPIFDFYQRGCNW